MCHLLDEFLSSWLGACQVEIMLHLGIAKPGRLDKLAERLLLFIDPPLNERTFVVSEIGF